MYPHPCHAYNSYSIPFTEGIDVDLPESPPAAVQELALRGQTLKLDLVVIVHFLPNSLDFDAWVKTEETTHTVFPLQEDLMMVWVKEFLVSVCKNLLKEKIWKHWSSYQEIHALTIHSS